MSKEQEVFIIAELSANHNGSIDNCFKLIDAAIKCGANAIKIQTYTPDTMTIQSTRDEFSIVGTIWANRNLYDLYKEAYLPWEWHEALFDYCKKKSIEIFSTPFDFQAVDFLEKLGVRRYKIASSELIDIPLIKYVAATGKPIIISTGMGTYEEIKEAVETVRTFGNGQKITLLKCTASYPAPVAHANLKTMLDIKKEFECDVGLSDHTMDNTSCIMSVAYGGVVIEKHFTLSRSSVGPDSAFSLEPKEFKQLVDDIRNAEKARGDICYGPTEAEKNSVNFRRSLYVVEDIKAGEKFNASNIRSIRPASGIKPKYYEAVLESYAARDISAGYPLNFIDIAGEIER